MSPAQALTLGRSRVPTGIAGHMLLVNLLRLRAPAYNHELKQRSRCMAPLKPQPWTHITADGQQEWLLRRNCSIAPGQLAVLFGSLATVSLTIGAVFAWRGAWLVLPFACIEVLALGVAFVVYARHATDYERIVLRDDCLLVETCQAARTQRDECSPYGARVEYSGTGRELIGLVAAGRRFEVGRLIPESERSRLAKQLRRQLRGFGP
jgi:uncharacterized membrane protein